MVSKFIPSKFSKPSSSKGSQLTNGQPRVIQEFKESQGSAAPFHVDYSGITAALDLLRDSNAIDDRKMLLEQLLVHLSHLPPGKLSTQLKTHLAVETLYNDLPHPPLTNVSDDNAFRAADGGGNNISLPDLGRAGTSYARSVQQAHPLPRQMLPDPGLLFDVLLKREEFEPHPAGLSSLMFSFAALVIHTVFRTKHSNVNVNETSSYVDLAPLYGVNADEQAKIRVNCGRGLLIKDSFCEYRLLLLPPAVGGLLILFNRNHNYIAKKLLEINERGTWTDPDKIPDTPDRAAIIMKQEREIFETARLINCGWFGSIVFSDYFSAILGLVRLGSSWSLDVFSEFRKLTHEIFERGRGNICSVEFNCLYRWHATTSLPDEEWTKERMALEFPGMNINKITPDDFRAKMTQIQNADPDKDLAHMQFAQLPRGKDGFLDNKGLADLLKNATEHPAGKFKARGTPESMRWIEMMGIEASRNWGCCSLNDFRRYLGLKPYDTFLEWNPDEKIAEAAERLYNDIEHLELYVGLQAEESKPVVKGAGLCPGYTISRAILADAVALIRGDRFFTADYTSHNLTAWGFADCQRSGDNAGFGSMLGRLLLRTLPTEYTENSSYTWFPLMTPPAMTEVLSELDVKEKYDLKRPSSKTGPADIKKYGEVAGILENKTKKFQDPFLDRVNSIIRGPGFFLATDNIERGEREQRHIMRAIAGTPEQADSLAKFFYDTTKTLISRNSYASVGGEQMSVDIVRDVLRVVPIHWVATQLADIKLKKNAADHGDYTENELFEILSGIYSYFFDDVESSRVLKLGSKVQEDVKNLLHHIKANAGAPKFSLSSIFGTVSQFFTLSSKSERQEIADRLQQDGTSMDQISNSILAVMVGASVELAEALAHMVNLLLDDANISKALAGDAKDDSILRGYISEVLRIDPPVQGLYRHVKDDEIVGEQSLRQTQLVFLDVGSASSDEKAFADPRNVNPTRSQENIIQGNILTRTLGQPILSKIMIQVLRAVLELSDVRRGPGQSGDRKRFSVELNGISMSRYLDQNQQFTPWAQSMVIQYDAKATA